MNSTVPAILDELEAAGVPVVLAADVEPSTIRSGVHLVRGDPTHERTISSARPAGAQQALITGASDGDVLVSAVILRKQAPDLPITALVTSASVREALHDLGVQHAVSADELVARTLATTLETPHAGEMVAQLVESTYRIASVQTGSHGLAVSPTEAAERFWATTLGSHRGSLVEAPS